MNRRFPYISLLKTLAMLMVVLLHSSLYFVNFNPFWPLRANAPDAVVDGMVRVLECMVVPGFFMASGFLLTRSLCVSRKGWPAQAAGRSKRLLLPYFVTGILYLVPVYTLLDLPFPLICFVYIYRNSEWVQSLPGAVYVSIFFPLAVLCTILLTRSIVKILSKINPPQSGKA